MGYVYKWVNNLNGKWYIGSHNGADPCYKASGIAIRRAFDKYGFDNFTRYIIHEGDDYRLVEELALISHDAENCIDSYNMKNAAIGGKTTGSFKKGHKSQSGKKFPEQSERMKRNNPNKGYNQKGSQNPNAKQIVIDGVYYETKKEACASLNTTYYGLSKMRNKED